MDMSDKRNTVLHKVGCGNRNVNFAKSSKEDRVPNISLNSDGVASRTGFHTFHVLIVNGAFFLCNLHPHKLL